jgi:CubicO group peptidase (beta-lactamase class C family)
MTSETLSAINVGAEMLGCVSPCLWSAGLAAAMLLCLAACSWAAEPVARFPGKSWERKSPAEVGLDEAKLQEFIGGLKMLAENRKWGPTKENPESYGVVIKDGWLVASWGEPSSKFSWYSASKPVLSTLLFHAVQEGRLKGVDDRIADWDWKLSDKDQPMTFAHLANMTSGYTLKDAPGTAFAYNDFGIHLYALTLDRVLGGKRLNEPAAGLFKDLQLEDGDVFGATQKGYGVVTSPRDFARIGWFWMHRGNWNGRAVLRREFFDNCMKASVPPNLPISTDKETDDYLHIESYGGGNNQLDYGPGIYGFCWWFNAPLPNTGRLNWPDAPTDTFAALGFGGNNMVMIPSRSLLVAARANWDKVSGAEADSRSNQLLKLLSGLT